MSLAGLNRRMNFKQAFLFLIHLIYIPVAIIYVFGFSEDINTDLLGLILVSIITVISFIYHTGVTLISYSIIKNPKYKFIAFLAPTIIAVLLKGILNILYATLDFGNDNTLWLLIGLSLLFNLGIYALIRKKPTHATAS